MTSDVIDNAFVLQDGQLGVLVQVGVGNDARPQGLQVRDVRLQLLQVVLGVLVDAGCKTEMQGNIEWFLVLFEVQKLC